MPEEEQEEIPTETVRKRLEEELGADRIHGLTVTRQDGETVYLVVAQSTTWDAIDETVTMDIPVLDLRTVVVDFQQQSVSISDNGLWVPQEAGVAENLHKLLARATTDLNGGTSEEIGPALRSAVENLDPELVLEREVEVQGMQPQGQHTDKMRNHTGIDPGRSWGYGAGPPPEVEHVVELLEEAGLDPADHLSRLVWGKKEPMDRKPRPVEELTGNYGIELQPRDSGLIAIDVDYPEKFPEGLAIPDTLEVSSPHGDDTQRHIILRCDRKKELAEEVGAWAVQAAPWGDLWIGDRYVVGPGSQLSEFGCDQDPYQRGERGGCEACEDEQSGFYEIVHDAPIATVEPEFILDLLEQSEGYELRNGPADNQPPEDEEDEEQGPDGQTCDNCGAKREPQELKTMELAGVKRAVCRGGCDE